MATVEFINQTVLVEARLHPGGQVQPLAFIWQAQRWTISSIGRQWPEVDAGQEWRCYLVQSAGTDTFELRLNPATGQWLLVRAWRAGRLA